MKKEIFTIIIIGLFVWLLSQFFYQICFVHGPSMEPTLHDNQMIFVKKYNLELTYNDIVVVKKKDNLIIKRIVGLPGDEIKIDHYLYRNGEQVDDFYMKENGDIFEVSLKEGEYFLLGDNRDESIDSRFREIGVIYRNEIIGKKIF